MKKLIKRAEKILTKSFIFFSIPILISILSFVYTKQIELKSEKKVKIALITEKVNHDSQVGKIILNNDIALKKYLLSSKNILKQLRHRTKVKNDIAKNIALFKTDSIFSTIIQLKKNSKQIAINIGENLVYSDNNFGYKNSNKNLTILLQTEYQQNQELISDIKQKKISNTYLDLDDKLLTYVTAMSLSSEDSLSIMNNQGLIINYSNQNLPNVKKQMRNLQENNVENLYFILESIIFILILGLFIIAISKKYFNSDLKF